ncbi:LOW QUALITY PROTEIN: RAD52 motif-containing protein 1-like [Trichechus inunguis]
MAVLLAVCSSHESDKTLVVWDLSSGPAAEDMHTSPRHSLFTVFSKFGLLYSVRVFPNTAVARPGFYAIIKFYSVRDAHRTQKACGRKQRFQSPVKSRNNFEWIIVNFISESGKIALEYRPSEEIIDARTEEELQDLIHVCGDKSSRVTQPV